LLPSPEDDCPELEVPAPVLAVPDPEPCAVVEPESVGLVWVLEPVLVVAEPVVGVEPVEVLPALALDELPVEAEADEPPPDPVELEEVVLFVVVVALAEPPEVGAGVGVGLGVGEGVGLGVGVGVGLVVLPAVPVVQLIGVPPPLPFDWAPPPEVVAEEVGEGVGLGFGATVVVEVVVVLEVVEVFDEPPLIDGFTLMMGSTVMIGALLTFATAVARAFPARWRP
jgi:hypothetical protein